MPLVQARARYPGELLFGISRRPLEILERLAREHGDACGFRVGPEQVVLLNRPDLVQRVLTGPPDRFHKGRALHRARRFLGQSLLTSEGEVHRRHRRLMQPAFHPCRLEGYLEAMARLTRQASGRLQQGQEFDLHGFMMELTLEIVTRTLLGSSVEGHSARVRACLEEALSKFQLTLLPFAELLERLPLPPFLRLRRAQRELDALVLELIEQHRRRQTDDLLSMLLEARDEAGEPLSERELRDEVLTLLLAGHETTANALTFTFWLLARHPLEEARLRREVDEVLGDRPPGPGDLARLVYARQVVKESLRLYPPAWLVGRRTLEELDLGSFRVPARSILLTSQWLLHRDARYWEEPDQVRPERFDQAQKTGRPRFAYFPFGAGARVCIGEGFALAEATIAVATLVRGWTFRTLEPGPPELMAGFTLRPRHGLRMVAHRRGEGDGWNSL